MEHLIKFLAVYPAETERFYRKGIITEAEYRICVAFAANVQALHNNFLGVLGAGSIIYDHETDLNNQLPTNN